MGPRIPRSKPRLHAKEKPQKHGNSISLFESLNRLRRSYSRNLGVPRDVLEYGGAVKRPILEDTASSSVRPVGRSGAISPLAFHSSNFPHPDRSVAPEAPGRTRPIGPIPHPIECPRPTIFGLPNDFALSSFRPRPPRCPKLPRPP